jgi:hypothetical protein
MRWEATQKREPRAGDIRIVQGFLWLPEKAQGQWRWLEVARRKQRLMSCVSVDESGWPHEKLLWGTIEWLPLV